MGFFGFGRKQKAASGRSAPSAAPAKVAVRDVASLAGLTPPELVRVILAPGAVEAVRAAAITGLREHPEHTEQHLATVAIQTADSALVGNLVDGIERRALVKQVATKAKASAVREAAAQRLAALDAASAAPSAQVRRNQRREAVEPMVGEVQRLGVAGDPLAAVGELEAILARRDAVMADYADLAVDDDTAAILSQIERVALRVQERAAGQRTAIDQREQICAAAEGADQRPPSAEAIAAWDAAAEVIGGAGQALAERWAALLQVVDSAGEAASETDTEPAESAPTATPSVSAEEQAAIEALLEESAAVAIAETPWREREDRLRVIDKELRAKGASAAQRDRFMSAFGAFKQQRREEREARSAARDQAAAAADKLTAALEALPALTEADAEQIAERRAAVRAARDQMRALQGVPGGARRRFQAAADAAYAPVAAADEQRDWERFANVPAAEALIEEVGVLGARPVDQALLDAVKSIQARWRDVGPLPRQRFAELKQAFTSACDAVYERLQPWFAERDAEREAAADQREALLGDLEALAAEAAPIGLPGSPALRDAWRSRLERMASIRDAWRAVGPVAKARNQPQWERYKAAMDQFHSKRKAANVAADAQREDNLEAKRAVLARLVTLAEDAEAFAAGKPVGGLREPQINQQLRSLRDEWREAGLVPRAALDEINAAFDAARDRVRAVLEPWFAARDEERADNLAAKQALIGELEELLEEERPDWFADDVHRIRQAWREVGPVPRAEKAVEDRFHDLCRQILAKPGADH